MTLSTKMIIVIAVGQPFRDSVESCVDSLSSAIHYADSDRRIIIIDNSLSYGIGTKMKALFPEVIVLPFNESTGELGSLYRGYCRAFIYALANFDFQILVKLDTDALFIDYGVADDAIAYFRENPGVGQLGKLCSVGDEIEWPRKWVLRQRGILGFTRHPRMPFFMREIVAKARKNGYEAGHHILGGTNILSYELIKRLGDSGYLPHPIMQHARLQEDHIFSLLCQSLGLTFVNYAPPDGSVAAVWRGLPAEPERLAAQGAKLIHSVRFYRDHGQDLDEQAIRSYFRKRRENSAMLVT